MSATGTDMVSGSDLTPANHMSLLHPPGSHGNVVIATKGRRWNERSMSAGHAGASADGLAGGPDVYISMQRFFGQRRSKRGLRELSALYVDLDAYKLPEWSQASPEHVCGAALQLLDDALLPVPSLVLSSGRGLQLIWLHTAVPARAACRWAAIERCLFEALEPLKADPNALDTARVLRLCGTVNSKSGTTVRTVFMSPAGHAGERYDFEYLAQEILPLDRLVLEEKRRRNVERRMAPSRRPTKPTTRKGYYAAVSADLGRLLEGRWQGHLPAGHRDDFLFVMAVTLAWLLPAARLPGRLEHLAARWAGWSPAETRTRLSAVVTRAAADAKRLPGRPMQRYRLAARSFVKRLEISEAEMQTYRLRVLLTQPLRCQRRAQRQGAYRRRHGQLLRAEYCSRGREIGRRAAVLRHGGASWAQVARALGLSSADAARMAARRTTPCPRPNKSVADHGGGAIQRRDSFSGRGTQAQTGMTCRRVGRAIDSSTCFEMAWSPTVSRASCKIFRCCVAGFSQHRRCYYLMKLVQTFYIRAMCGGIGCTFLNIMNNNFIIY